MSSRQTSHRLALYNWCFIERISASRGTPYPCNQHDLDVCDFGSDRPPHSLQSQDHATTHLEHFLDPNARISSTVQAAMVRLQAALRVHDWKPDLIIKAFNDLDIVFFDGQLRGRTTIHWRRGSWWAELERSRGRPHKSFAITRSLHHRRAAIELNAWEMFMNTPDAKVAMWKITLHEMVVSLYPSLALSILNSTSNYTYTLPPHSIPIRKLRVVLALQPSMIILVAGTMVTG